MMMDELEYWKRLTRTALVEIQNYDAAMELIFMMQQIKAEMRGWV